MGNLKRSDGDIPLGFREDFYFNLMREAGVVVFEAFWPFDQANPLFEVVGVEADLVQVGAAVQAVKVEVKNRRVVRVFVQDGIGGGADGPRETETFADPATDDRLAGTQVPVKGHLVARLQATSEFYRPVISFLF